MWKECVDNDLRKVGLERENAQDRAAWRVPLFETISLTRELMPGR